MVKRQCVLKKKEKERLGEKQFKNYIIAVFRK